MRYRDKALFALPTAILVAILLFGAFVFFQLSHLERVYMKNAETELEVRTELAKSLIESMLAQKRPLEEIAEWCRDFNRKFGARITLIDDDGTVLVDSMESPGSLANHAARPEIIAAKSGKKSIQNRFSTTLNIPMLYYAAALNAPDDGKLVLRLAFGDRELLGLFNKTRNIVLGVLGMAVLLIALLVFYMLKKIHLPLEKLQLAAGSIAAGNYNTTLPVPDGVLLKELAWSLSRMAEQLKRQLRWVTQERNEQEAIFNAMSDGVIVADQENRIVKHNRACTRFFSRITENNLTRLGSPELLHMANSVRQEGKARTAEIILEELNAKPKTILAYCGRVTLPDSVNPESAEGIILVLSDLTLVRQLESFRSDFVANVSHEIKTPLTGIMMAVETLENTGHFPEDARPVLAILAKQSLRLNALVQDILNLSSLERKELEIERGFSDFSLAPALENAVDLCRANADKKKIKLELSCPENLKIHGDVQLIEQAVCNLIFNAVLYSGSTLPVEISARVENDCCKIEVRDHGCGIDLAHQGRIFERFYRVDSARSRELGGTGLGLSIVKHIARLHHGEVSLESAKGEGCRFTISIPMG